MANPWSIAATGWAVIVIGWLLVPILSLLVNKLFAYLVFDASKELPELELVTIPALKETLRRVEQQRMVRAATDEEGSRSDLEILDKMDMRLKSALYQAEDILDLVDYHQIEKKLAGDGSSWVKRLITAAVACLAGCCRWSWVTAQGLLHTAVAWMAGCWGTLLQRCVDITPAPLLLSVQWMNQTPRQLFRSIISLWNSGTLLPVYQATSTVGFQRCCAWCCHLVANITTCCQSLLSWCTDRIADARYYRDWSYEQVSFKINEQKDGNVPVTERIRLRKQIKSIEDILTFSKKSNLLNQNSSSTAKDDDKESSSNSTAKNSDKDSTKKAGNKDSSNSTAKQKEIDKLYRSIEQKVFGRDKDRKHISDMLREGQGTNAAGSSTSKPYSVIGIYGITGSGKSTLAQYVCDYEKDAGHFNLIIFILVGKTFSVGDIFSEMLDKIKKQRSLDTNGPEIQKTELKDLISLKAELEKELHGKCFLLVLDDLWVNADNMKERGILLDLLNSGQTGSRILVTAQKKDAGAALGAQKQIPIPDMEEDHYLLMFMHYAIDVSQVNSADYGRYEAIGRKITKKLRGSPIAANTVAARLRRNNSIDFWETTANLDVLNETMGALWWSYEKLGGNISQCFTYCSIFPKGYGIKRDKLVRLWIAQGFVKTRNNATEELEDIGQSYFDQLLTFSFLQVQRTYFGKETTEFTIHDLLHELAERVSGGDFFRIGSNDPPKDIPRGVHHLSIETNNAAEKILDLDPLNRNLRTLIIKEEPYARSVDVETVKRRHDLEKLLERLFMRLTKLRVLIIKLNLESYEFSVPESIDHMKHLRYLDICFHDDSLSNLILPSTFSKLYHIQNIDIPCREAKCPEDMANLKYLRHISAQLSFPNIGRLTALQTLEKFTVKEEPGYELKQLMHLNSLRGSIGIWDLEIVGSKYEAIEAHLTHKKQLRILNLVFRNPECRSVKWDPDVEAEVLEGLCPPKDLQELGIYLYEGSRYPSWMLSHHRADAPKRLHTLDLIWCSQLSYIPEGSELFTGLRKLRIRSCDWNSLPENMERLVLLQTLEIQSCEKIEHLPTLPQALKTIEISWCDMLRSFGIMDCPTGTPEQSPYPMIPCPCLVTLEIEHCPNLVTLPILPPSLKKLRISHCGEICSVSGQLGQLVELDIIECKKLQSVQSLGDASSLEELFLSCCQCLSSLGSNGGPGSYLALQRFYIKECPAMDMKQFNKNVLSRFGGPGSYLALQRFYIKECPAMDMKQFNKNVLSRFGYEEISHDL